MDVIVRQTKVTIPLSIIKDFPESSLAALLSGRWNVDLKDNLPFIDRDPFLFT